MQKLHWTYLLVAFFLIAVTGCQKMEEIEPIMDRAVPSERGIYVGEEDDTDNPSVDWSSSRSGVERPDDTLDNVNDDDDEEDDDEEQSLVLD